MKKIVVELVDKEGNIHVAVMDKCSTCNDAILLIKNSQFVAVQDDYYLNIAHVIKFKVKEME